MEEFKGQKYDSRGYETDEYLEYLEENEPAKYADVINRNIDLGSAYE